MKASLVTNIQLDCDEQVEGMNRGQTGVRNKTETHESKTTELIASLIGYITA